MVECVFHIYSTVVCKYIVVLEFTASFLLQVLVGSDNRSLQTMATEQLVDLLTNDTTRSLSNKESRVRVKRRKGSTSGTVSAQKSLELWNIEELWDMSQVQNFRNLSPSFSNA